MAVQQKTPDTEEKVLTKKELKEQQKLAKQKQKDKKPKKEKKPGLFKKMREAWSELKKTTKPTFSEVLKRTGVVILVVVIFTIVLFGIDYLLGLLYSVFMG